MKDLYLVGGTMGVGKTTACQALKKRLNNSVFLDGDWCWDSNPFQVTEETKAMVLGNICFLLNSFLRCSAYDSVIFCWVMHEQSILDDILSRVRTGDCSVKKISLVCSPEALEERLLRDVRVGARAKDIVPRSLARLPLYEKLDTVKVDVTRLTPEETAEAILRI